MPAPLWYGNVVAAAALLAALVLRGAWHSWPWLTGFMAATIARDAALMALPQRSVSYFWTYVFLEPTLLVLLSGAVIEAWRLRTAYLIGVGNAGRILLLAALLGSSVLSAAMALKGGGPWDHQLRAMLSARHWIMTVLATFTLAGLAVLEGLRARTSSPVRTGQWMLAAYLLVHSAAAASGALAPQDTLPLINIGALGAGTVLFVAWAWTVRPAPQTAAPRPGPRAEEVERKVQAFLTTLREAAMRK